MHSSVFHSKPAMHSNFWENVGYSAEWKSSVLWNAMIHPLLNMTIKGALWYQGNTSEERFVFCIAPAHTVGLLLFIPGEANSAYNRDKYNCTFPAMIDDWRMAFHQGSGGQTALDFPFGFVQVLLNSQKWNKMSEENY